jgi:hypothetical protein
MATITPPAKDKKMLIILSERLPQRAVISPPSPIPAAPAKRLKNTMFIHTSSTGIVTFFSAEVKRDGFY